MMEVEEVGKEAILYTNVCPYNVIIHRLQCKNNECTLQFLDLQGTDIKIYNVNNDILYTHTLLNAYTSAMSSSCKSMESWRTDMNRLFSFFLFPCLIFFSCFTNTHKKLNVALKNTQTKLKTQKCDLKIPCFFVLQIGTVNLELTTNCVFTHNFKSEF